MGCIMYIVISPPAKIVQLEVLKVLKGNINTFMVTIIARFLGHNGSQDLRKSQVHMINET